MTRQNLLRALGFGLALLIGAFAAFAQPAAAPPAAAPRPRVPASPEIHADRTVTFRISAPKANEVTLNGSWEGAKDLKMNKDDGGVWSTTVGPLPAQLFGYWYL